jgi:hypothetical protein
MERTPVRWRALITVLSIAFLPAAASAGQKIAIFPFDMTQQKSEDDYFVGPKGPTKDEARRLDLVREELAKLMAADGRYEIVDLSGLAQDITAAAPLNQCNGCEVDIAAKAKAELAMTSVIDKISETHLSLNVAIVDVAKSSLVKNASVLIQGNTDESWLHGVRWIAKNRLLAEGEAK